MPNNNQPNVTENERYPEALSPPNGYFENLPSKVLSEINKRKRRRLWVGAGSTAIAAALALLVVFYTGFWQQNKPTSQTEISTQKLINALPNQAIENYLAYAGTEDLIGQYASQMGTSLLPDSTIFSDDAILETLENEDIEFYLQNY